MIILDAIKNSGVVAAVKDDASFDRALASDTQIIFLLKSDILSAEDKVHIAHEKGKKVLIHIDLMDGIGKDETAIKYIAEIICADGIITTKPMLIKCAKSLGLFSVLRVFIIDSQGLASAIANADKLMPDAVEIMPGLVPKIIPRFAPHPVIVGGLVSTREEIDDALSFGAIGASTSRHELW